MSYKVGMVSLGCSKNQVDAEMMLALITQGGFTLCADPSECDVVIINTCGFIEDAKKESIENILEFCQMKAEGRLKSVVVTGCLAERYREEVAKEIPEADVVLGIGSNSQIVEAIRQSLEGKKVVRFGDKNDLSMEGDRVLANAPYFAYLKVAEGCDNRCSYCAIPLIRGGFRSRKIEDILQEAQRLADRGVKEINVVAQDTTRYGEDLYGKKMLPELLRQLCAIDQLKWVRILYCYPERIIDELIDTMASEPKIVPYFDIPIQHVSGRVLKAMNRQGDAASLAELLNKIRERVPHVVLRTTLIAGFPGETQEDFEELCNFVLQTRFERLGCFAYSREEDTPAAEMSDQIDEETKLRRTEIIMETQMSVAQDFNESIVGTQLDVLVEGYDRHLKRYYGRSYMDAPDIDTKTYFLSKHRPQPGDMVQVLVTETSGYDLMGKRIEEE